MDGGIESPGLVEVRVCWPGHLTYQKKKLHYGDVLQDLSDELRFLLKMFRTNLSQKEVSIASYWFVPASTFIGPA